MQTVVEKREGDPTVRTDGLRFEDGMTEAMVATASGYFFNGSEKGDQDAHDFRKSIQNFHSEYPEIARMVVAAGLMEAGFKIGTNPKLIETPDEENPENALDRRMFMDSWYNVASTVLGMGWRGTSKESGFFNQQTVDFVREEIGSGDEN